MSTTTPEATAVEAPPAPAPAAPAPAAPAPAAATPARDPDVTTFRGRALEELLPQIREQLGPDAVVVRQREGLMGGIGGFFQQRFVEVDAKPGGPRIDVYDDEPAAPTAPEPFAALLAAAETAGFETAGLEPADEGAPRPRPETSGSAPLSPPEPAPFEPPATPLPALLEELMRAGMSHAFAERLIEDAEAHELPFAGGDLRQAVRRALARRVPTAMPYRAGGLAVAFAGPGSTSCADALATAYAAAGRRAHAVATVEQARTKLERGAPDALVALDLPPISTDHDGVAALARQLPAIELDELLVVVPAGLDLPSARALHDRLAPLAPTGLALACTDPAEPLGAAVELACTTRLPLAFVLAGGAIAPADPAALVERLLP